MSVPGSYSGDPSTSPLDEVRFLIGDTNSAGWELGDAEILYLLGPNPPASGNYLAAAYAAEGIASRYKGLVDKTIGDLHVTHSQKQKNYQYISGRLRSRAAISKVAVYAGGLSHAEKRANNADVDIATVAVKIDDMNEENNRNDGGITGEGA